MTDEEFGTNWLSQPMARLVHEAGSTILTFAFSRRGLKEMMGSRFKGNWESLDYVRWEIPAKRANRACIEMAIFMRALDDQHKISEEVNKTVKSFGILVHRDDTRTNLKLRDVANKIIHAKNLNWEFSDSANPKFICTARTEDSWVRAEIDLIAIATFLGMIAS